jgi:hypothetical protein
MGIITHAETETGTTIVTGIATAATMIAAAPGRETIAAARFRAQIQGPTAAVRSRRPTGRENDGPTRRREPQ